MISESTFPSLRTAAPEKLRKELQCDRANQRRISAARTSSIALAASIAIALTACSAFRTPAYAVPPPPAASFVPAAAPTPQPEHAVITRASWYGPEFNGRPTATGERYDPNKLTAASRTMPLGTVVHVTNLENGRSVKVRINDKGPFVHGRGLDLSRKAAQKIGMTHKGVVRVKVARVKPTESEADAPE